jgi:O-antigen ligase
MMVSALRRTALPLGLILAAAVLGVAAAYSPLAVAALAVAIFGGVLLLRWPVVGSAVLLGSLVVGQLVRFSFSGGTANLLPTDILLPAVIGVWLLARIATGTIPFTASRLTAPVLAWLAAIALSLLLGLRSLNLDSHDSLAAALYAVRWLLYFGAFLLTADSIRSVRVARAIIFTLLACAVVVALLGFVQLRVLPDFSSMVPKGWDPHVGRLLSTWFDPNFVGGFFAFTLLLALGIAWDSRGGVRIALLAAVTVLLAALLLTYSRSAYAGLLVGGALFAVLRARILLVIGALIAIVAFAAVPRIQERVIGVRSVDETTSLRIVSWNNALEVARDHPVFGVGYNAYRFAQVSYAFLNDPAEHSAGGSDSSFLTVLVTTGVFGLTAYLWLLIAMLRTAWAGTRRSGFARGLGYGSLCGLVALIVHGQFINGLLFPHLMLAMWIVLGTIVALERIRT